jgi:hypothetical protein
MCDQPEGWDFDDPSGDDPDHETDGGAFGGFGVGGFLDNEGSQRAVAPPWLDRANVEAGFASCQWQILLILLEVFPGLLLRWVTVVRGDTGTAVHALRGVYDPDIQIYDDPNLKWVARWLIAIARLYPARHAALMAALWSVPRLHRAGYQVLGVTHPGWTELLPEFAPPEAADEVAALVRRGAPRRACKLLDTVDPGWQVALVRATGTW